MNRLAGATSPYLLQHDDNPVDWYPWGDEAFERARAEDKPVLLSVGYAACHWCHVMAHESFEDPATAGVMNERFVSIKVDREERPDVDAVYMDAVRRADGARRVADDRLPDARRRAVLRRHVLPPEPRHGMPAFREVLVRSPMRTASGAATSARQARALVEALQRSAQLQPSRDPLTESLLGEAVRGLRSQFDARGAGSAPRRSSRRRRRSSCCCGAGELELGARRRWTAMAAGGMYDVVGGGFHRYSVDERWLVPHFEKMLYDNALLVPVYLHAWRRRPASERYREVAEETLDYMLRELRARRRASRRRRTPTPTASRG